MVALEPIKKIKEKKKQLLKQQEELVEILKTKHKDFYEWMIKKNVDPYDLKAYSIGLATAVSIFMASADTQDKLRNTPKLTPQVHIIEVDELVGKSEQQKAELVWDRYGFIIKRNAEKYKVDTKLIFATIMLESGGNTYAVRQEPSIGDASYGLGQLLYGTARGLGFEGKPEELFDPEINIAYIAMYHSRNDTVYGGLNPVQLTTAYNTGSPYSNPLPGHLDKFNKWYGLAQSFAG